MVESDESCDIIFYACILYASLHTYVYTSIETNKLVFNVIIFFQIIMTEIAITMPISFFFF